MRRRSTNGFGRCVTMSSTIALLICSIYISNAACFSVVSFVIPSASSRIRNDSRKNAEGTMRIPRPTVRYMNAGNPAAGEGSDWNRNPNNNRRPDNNTPRNQQQPIRRKRKKYERKRPKTKSEVEYDRLRRSRQAEYEEVMKNNKRDGTLWIFETLFPEPVLDEDTIQRDLFEVSERDRRTKTGGAAGSEGAGKVGEKVAGIEKGSSLGLAGTIRDALKEPVEVQIPNANPGTVNAGTNGIFGPPILDTANTTELSSSSSSSSSSSTSSNSTAKINRPLTRMVEDRLYGFRRAESGEFEYSTSLISDDRAVQFRDGVRLSNPLRVNSDRLTYFAKKELSRGRLEESQELYEEALSIDPRDGRAYLGLSRIAQRRRDFQRARECLVAGIENSATNSEVHLVTGNPVYLNGVGI